MANNTILRGTPFFVTNSGTTSAQAVTTVTNVRYYLTDITGTSTTSGTWAILGGAAGTAVFWQGTGNVAEGFIEPLMIPSIGTISFLLNGSGVTYANISGYYI